MLTTHQIHDLPVPLIQRTYAYQADKQSPKHFQVGETEAPPETAPNNLALAAMQSPKNAVMFHKVALANFNG